MIKFRVMLLPCGKLIGLLLFCLLLFLLSILFMKSKYVHTKHTRNEIARLAMGTIFLVNCFMANSLQLFQYTCRQILWVGLPMCNFQGILGMDCYVLLCCLEYANIFVLMAAKLTRPILSATASSQSRLRRGSQLHEDASCFYPHYACAIFH